MAGRPAKGSGRRAKRRRRRASRKAIAECPDAVAEANRERGLERLSEFSPHERDVYPKCWGCGNPSPVKSGLRARGWHTRFLKDKNCTEIYCHDCFQAFGWGTTRRPVDTFAEGWVPPTPEQAIILEDGIILCNCALCHCRLRASGEANYSLCRVVWGPDAPEQVYQRINDRPYCLKCVSWMNREKAAEMEIEPQEAA